MIVFPQALVLSEGATEFPLTHGRILYDNYGYGALPSQVTVSSETADGPADAPLRPETYEYWQGDGFPATWELNFGGIKSVDSCGIAGHDIGTVGASVKAETSTDGSTWEDLSLEHTPSNDAPILFLDTARNATRVRITLAGAGAVPKLASIYVGAAMKLARPIYGGHSPLSLSRETVHEAALSRGGQFLGQAIRRMGVVGTVSLSNLKADWYRSTFDKFVERTRNLPYFYAWRPASFPLEVVYVWNTDDIVPQNSGRRDYMEVNWKVRGLGWTTHV